MGIAVEPGADTGSNLGRMTNTALYDCVVKHQRLQPQGYKFTHNIFMFFLDLDELELINSSSMLVGYERRRLYSLRDDDHLPGYSGNIKEKLQVYLRAQNFDWQRDPASSKTLGKVFLLTNLRVLGYVFNPVSFFFCLNENGQHICSVAEVGNTFDEKKLFFLPHNDLQQFAARLPKEFYVSPFSDLQLDFDFQVTEPSATIQINIDEYKANESTQPVLLSSVAGVRRSFGDQTVLALTMKYPLVTLRIILLVHWHAFMLLVKKVPFFAKDKNPELQKNVLNARHSNKTELTAKLEAERR